MNSRLEEIAYNRGYRISIDGSIINPKGKILKGNIRTANRKYSQLVFTLKVDGKSKHCGVHRLQAYQKYGNKIYGNRILVRHIDGNYLNNSFDNIEIGNHLDNYLDIPQHKREEHLNNMRLKRKPKYSQELINSIKREYDLGMPKTVISNKYKLSINSITYILKK